MNSDWTPERVEILARLWAQGLSAGEIGRRMGITKNAVVGKVHRVGLPKRPSPIKRDPNAKRPRRPLRRSKMVIDPSLITLQKLAAGMCRWPIGEPGTAEFHFCGETASPDKPYCPTHCEAAYVKPSRHREETENVAVASSVGSEAVENDDEAAA